MLFKSVVFLVLSVEAMLDSGVVDNDEAGGQFGVVAVELQLSKFL